MAIFGTFISLGIGAGQSLGSYIYMHSNYNVLFLSSGILAILSFALMINVKETLKDRIPFSTSVLKVKKTDIIEPEFFRSFCNDFNCILFGYYFCCNSRYFKLS